MPVQRKLDHPWPFPQSVVGKVLFKNVIKKEKVVKPSLPLDEAPF